LIWLKSEHGISWTHGKVNQFRGLQATFMIRKKAGGAKSPPLRMAPESTPFSKAEVRLSAIPFEPAVFSFSEFTEQSY